MQYVGETLSALSFDFPVEKPRSKRADLLNQLYQLYVSQPEINRKENRKRYHSFVRLHDPSVCKKAGFSKERYDQYKPLFKKAKLAKEDKYITYLSEKVFAIKMSHVDSDGLEILISKARDSKWRGYCVAKTIMGAIKWNVDKPLA